MAPPPGGEAAPAAWEVSTASAHGNQARHTFQGSFHAAASHRSPRHLVVPFRAQTALCF